MPRPPRPITSGLRHRRLLLLLLPAMANLAAVRTALASKLRMVRLVSLLAGALNLALLLLGSLALAAPLSTCSAGAKLPFAVVSLAAGVKIAAMVGAGRAQHATAATIVSYQAEGSLAADAAVRIERRVRYRRWLLWTRFGVVITGLQFIGAVYLVFVIVSDISYEKISESCFLGQDTADQAWKQTLVVLFVVLAWLVVILQCFMGSDILRWRSFYATHDTAWKVYYGEVFDHGIREALCCLGRAKYMTVLEEDEVYSVARLLGDLVAYRASGTGHLELLAGLALLQSHGKLPNLQSELMEAPVELIEEAAILHPFAEAAYTGPLLDFGRNPMFFPCAWLYRQGVLTPWARNRRPSLDGDNWWRGHAAAFLRFVGVPPETLLRGRVCQTKREAAYFVVVLHDLRSIVISVRGTETPEDLITDGLGRECELTEDDLDGLMNEQLPAITRQRVISTFPHYGHAGIVQSARELFMQVDCQPGENSTSGTSGLLSSLLGVGCECEGYKLCIVGHSLGGAVATLLGLRLFRRYPNLHVYSFGALPCVDLVIAEACSDFVTTIIYNDEFSARLSVNSILRLRSAAIAALSDDSSADSVMIRKLARRILHLNKYFENSETGDSSDPSLTPITLTEDRNNIHTRRHFELQIPGRDALNQELYPERASLCDNLHSGSLTNGCDLSTLEVLKESPCEYLNHQGLCFSHSSKIYPVGGQISEFAENQTLYREVPVERPEMFLAGLIIHIVRQPTAGLPVWKWWSLHEKDHSHRAFVARRESFMDIVVTPYMFLDHLPWRCQYAIQRVLQGQKLQDQYNVNESVGEHLV